MRKIALVVVTVMSLVASRSEQLIAQSPAPGAPASPEDARLMPRVRSADSTVADLIVRAYEWSATFRRVVDLIDATDGIVYVQPGRCGKNVRACTALTVTVAGPSRILRIVVDPRKPDCDLMASIGHELWHAFEVLRDPSLTTDADLFFFYAREGRHGDRDGDPLGAWETQAARKTGDEVRAELRRRADQCVGNQQ